MARTGSHSTRERLSANIIPFADFERGALPELKDDVARWRLQVAGMEQNSKPFRILRAKIRNAEDEIKRLNREASETYERRILWQAARNALTDAQFLAVSDEAKRLRLLAEGVTT